MVVLSAPQEFVLEEEVIHQCSIDAIAEVAFKSRQQCVVRNRKRCRWSVFNSSSDIIGEGLRFSTTFWYRSFGPSPWYGCSLNISGGKQYLKQKLRVLSVLYRRYRCTYSSLLSRVCCHHLHVFQRIWNARSLSLRQLPQTT
jgi:hypothetical protein